MHAERTPAGPRRFLAPLAWVGGAWARQVLLTVGPDGHWSGIQAEANAQDHPDATVLAGPVLPGLVNAHSHAFQRAIAGLTERRGGQGSAASDDFWSWRDRMYSVAQHITPAQLESIAAMLYAELLSAGYTQVCEFHYLHHAMPGGSGGQAQADPLDMSLALVRAAQKVGMGLTLMPTLYQRSGFGAAGLRPDQMRFASTTDSLMRLVDDLQMQVRGLVNFNVGLAVHSLRAADAAAITEAAAFAEAQGLPVHIHIAEQTQEVQDCLAHTGQRPIEWLLDHQAVNAHWNLVHATHTTPAELAAVGRRGAAIVICPSTEANLGDGVFDYPGYAAVRGVWSIGSDSHVTRSWTEELRLLEYSQRLALRQRNVAAQIGASTSTAANLFEAAVAGGAAASGQPLGALAVGNRADFQVLDAQSPALLGVPDQSLLDALIFSSPAARCHQVYVAGQLRVSGARLGAGPLQTDQWPRLANDFVQTMRALWP